MFRTRTRDEWMAVFEGSDACVAPVLDMDEAPRHPHNRARDTFVRRAGRWQPNAAPRFSRTPSRVRGDPAPAGSGAREALRAWGVGAGEIDALIAAEVVGARKPRPSGGFPMPAGQVRKRKPDTDG